MAENDKLNVYQKINEIKKVVDVFDKDASTSGKGAYTYTSGSQILKAIKNKMQEVGLLFMPVKTEHRGYREYHYKNTYGDDKTDFLVDGKLFYEWINIDNPDDRQRVEFEYYGQQNDLSKAFGSALTYSERYLLLKSLGVPTDEDDPDKVTQEKTAKNTATTAKTGKTDKRTETPKQSATSQTINLDEALNYEVKLKGNVYKIGELSNEQINWLISKSDGKIKACAEIVKKRRLADQRAKLQEFDGELPFPEE